MTPGKNLKKPFFLAVKGTFFPCLLLYSGWWERLNEDDEQHTISRRLDKTATFSAYLWQCWGPKQWLKDKKMPRLDEVHTDFTKQQDSLPLPGR